MPHTGGYAKKIGMYAIVVLSGPCTLPISLLFPGPRRSEDAKLAKSLSCAVAVNAMCLSKGHDGLALIGRGDIRITLNVEDRLAGNSIASS